MTLISLVLNHIWTLLAVSFRSLSCGDDVEHEGSTLAQLTCRWQKIFSEDAHGSIHLPMDSDKASHA